MPARARTVAPPVSSNSNGTPSPGIAPHELDADEDFGAEPGGLRVDAGGELGAADAVREAGVVLDPRARPRLPARSERLDDERPQPLRSGVERGRQAGRAGSEDRDVVELVLRLASAGPRAWRARA